MKFLPACARILLLIWLTGTVLSVQSWLGSSAQESTDSIVCRITLSATLLALPTIGKPAVSTNTVACIPIVDNRETADLFSIDLPLHFWEQHAVAAANGTLLVSIEGASITRKGIVATAQATFQVLPELPNSSRHLSLDDDPNHYWTTGIKTIAVVRISTRDAEPTYSTADMERGIFGDGLENDGVTMPTQYNACSFGKLRFIRSVYGVVDLKLDRTLGSFESVDSIFQSAQKQLVEEHNLDSITDLGDKILFCLPPGTGSWIAVAGVRHWRALFNDQWCLSLSALMHEVGHTVGLMHSNEAGQIYGDQTGYMGFGRLAVNTPRQCFNGHKNDVLGWYKDRVVAVDPKEDGGGARLYKIAAFVDYDKAASNEPVILDVGGQIFLQYNRAKGFNVGTEEKGNTLTITEYDGTDSSTNLGGLKVGEEFGEYNFQHSGHVLMIQVCETIIGDSNSPDAMIVSVGLDQSLCRNAQMASPQADIQGMPFPLTASPTVSPTVATNYPTMTPTLSPTSPPVLNPTRRPTTSPTHSSMFTETSHSTNSPTFRPSEDTAEAIRSIEGLPFTRTPTLAPSALPVAAPGLPFSDDEQAEPNEAITAPPSQRRPLRNYAPRVESFPSAAITQPPSQRRPLRNYAPRVESLPLKKEKTTESRMHDPLRLSD